MIGLSDRTYCAKVLLFGEQTVLFGSEALSIPYPDVHGKWQWNELVIDQSLLSLTEQLNDKTIDVDQFKWDINKGLFFDSNIPYSYGLGSSGALTAAIYDRYKIKDDSASIEEIKSDLAMIESIFHGKSSGIDALVSYKNQAVWKYQDHIKLLNLEDLDSTIQFYLVDSHTDRSSKTYINLFKNLVNTQAIDISEMNLLVNNCISGLLKTDKDSNLLRSCMTISQLQLKVLRDFIPLTLQHIWATGIEQQTYYIKLCGAGGGGYFIVMSTEDLQSVGGYPLVKIM